MDIELRRAIYQLLRVWEQCSSTRGEDGHTLYATRHIAAMEGAAAFIARLGLGDD